MINIIGGLIAIAVLILVYKTTRKKDVVSKVIYMPIEIPNLNLNFEELILLGYINEYRKFKGLCVLKIESKLSELSINHTDYMIDKHSPSHDNFFTRQKESQAKMFGEIAGMRTSAPLDMFQAYLRSKNHREVIENKNYEWIGLNYKGRFNCCLFAKY
jgi:uncharacterized protein YkwD